MVKKQRITFNLLQDFLNFMFTAITVYIDLKNTSLQKQSKPENEKQGKVNSFIAHKAKPEPQTRKLTVEKETEEKSNLCPEMRTPNLIELN